MRPPLPRTKQHCSVKSEFGYFATGCFTDRPTPVHSPATAYRQSNEQHQIKEDSDAAEYVAVDILQKSDEIHRVDFLGQLHDSKLNKSCVAAACQVSSPSSAQESQTKKPRSRGGCVRSSSEFLLLCIWCVLVGDRSPSQTSVK